MNDVTIETTKLGTTARVVSEGKTLGIATVSACDDAVEKATAYALSSCGLFSDPRVVAYAAKDEALRAAIESHLVRKAYSRARERYASVRR